MSDKKDYSNTGIFQCTYLSSYKMLFFLDYCSYFMCYNCQEEMAIGTDRPDILMKEFEDYIFILYLGSLDFV